jgi:hypothetical protein
VAACRILAKGRLTTMTTTRRLRIADELRDASEAFRYHWNLYRLLFANAPTNLEEHEPDGYDSATAQTGYRTFAGEIVKRAPLHCLMPGRGEPPRPFSVSAQIAVASSSNAAASRSFGDASTPSS